MSYNGSGSYNAPAGNPVVAGTTIQASWANTLVSDLGNTFNNVLPRDGQAAMSGVLKIQDGAITTPGLAFNSESTTGFYKPTTSTVALAILGSNALSVTNALTAVQGNLTVGGNLTATGAATVGSITSSGTFTANALTADSLTTRNSGPMAITYGAASTFSIGNGSTKLALDTGGNVTLASSGASLSNVTAINDGQLAGMRNKLINGDFRFWQRGTSFTATANNPVYSADRWYVYRNGANNFTGTQVAGTYGQYAIKLQRTAGDTSNAKGYFSQVIESADVYALRGKTVTVSFYHKCGADYLANTPNLALSLGTGTGVDEGAASFQLGNWSGMIVSYQLVAPTTSYQKSYLTFTVPSNANEIGIAFWWSANGTAGADESLTIEQVQLELGNQATPFELRSADTEYNNCLRFFYRAATGTTQDITMGYCTSTTSSYFLCALPTAMRVVPSIKYSNFAHFQVLPANVACNSALTISASSTSTKASLTVPVASGLTANTPALLQTNNASAYLDFNAEL